MGLPLKAQNVSTPMTHPSKAKKKSNSSSHPGELESWTSWVRRITRTVEAQLGKCRMDDWLTAWRERVWRWAHRVATAESNSLQYARWALVRWVCGLRGCDPSREAPGPPVVLPGGEPSSDFLHESDRVRKSSSFDSAGSVHRIQRVSRTWESLLV